MYILSVLDLQDTIRYDFVEVNEVTEFFYLNPDDGTITLRRSLEESSLSMYSVRIWSHRTGGLLFRWSLNAGSTVK